jgi:hypothetical protein
MNIRQNTEANDDGSIAPPLGLHIHFCDIYMILQAINRIQRYFVAPLGMHYRFIKIPV